jgi:hypothetical protein
LDPKEENQKREDRLHSWFVFEPKLKRLNRSKLESLAKFFAVLMGFIF